MARKPNYGFDKRRKEQDRKAKKDAKAAERRQRRDERSSATSLDDPSVTDPANPGAELPNDDESNPETPRTSAE